MRLIPSDPDIQTLVTRIENAELDLQPDFQRGEIWTLSKRQRLVDSVLRDWHVPPVHVILEAGEQSVSVLDGQQRLAAIRDFVHGAFPIDGETEPLDAGIRALHGLRFKELPPEIQRRIQRFPIRLFTIVDYDPAEPAELFYRLNQPSALTPAEQRNAFFGPARKQVRELVDLASDFELPGGLFGFSNARMAFDDVLTRTLYLLDEGTLRVKVSSSVLADKYRSESAFSKRSLNSVSESLMMLAWASEYSPKRVKLNKATAQTWLVFGSVLSIQFPGISRDQFGEYFNAFESERARYRNREVHEPHAIISKRMANSSWREYESRSTSRVSDVSSVVLRDLVVWIFFLDHAVRENWNINPDAARTRLLRELKLSDSHSSVEWLADELEWGSEL